MYITIPGICVGQKYDPMFGDTVIVIEHTNELMIMNTDRDNDRVRVHLTLSGEQLAANGIAMGSLTKWFEKLVDFVFAAPADGIDTEFTYCAYPNVPAFQDGLYNRPDDPAQVLLNLSYDEEDGSVPDGGDTHESPLNQPGIVFDLVEVFQPDPDNQSKQAKSEPAENANVGIEHFLRLARESFESLAKLEASVPSVIKHLSSPDDYNVFMMAPSRGSSYRQAVMVYVPTELDVSEDMYYLLSMAESKSQKDLDDESVFCDDVIQIIFHADLPSGGYITEVFVNGKHCTYVATPAGSKLVLIKYFVNACFMKAMNKGMVKALRDTCDDDISWDARDVDGNAVPNLDDWEPTAADYLASEEIAMCTSIRDKMRSLNVSLKLGNYSNVTLPVWMPSVIRFISPTYPELDKESDEFKKLVSSQFKLTWFPRSGNIVDKNGYRYASKSPTDFSKVISACQVAIDAAELFDQLARHCMKDVKGYGLDRFINDDKVAFHLGGSRSQSAKLCLLRSAHSKELRMASENCAWLPKGAPSIERGEVCLEFDVNHTLTFDNVDYFAVNCIINSVWYGEYLLPANWESVTKTALVILDYYETGVYSRENFKVGDCFVSPPKAAEMFARLQKLRALHDFLQVNVIKQPAMGVAPAIWQAVDFMQDGKLLPEQKHGAMALVLKTSVYFADLNRGVQYKSLSDFIDLLESELVLTGLTTADKATMGELLWMSAAREDGGYIAAVVGCLKAASQHLIDLGCSVIWVNPDPLSLAKIEETVGEWWSGARSSIKHRCLVYTNQQGVFVSVTDSKTGNLLSPPIMFGQLDDSQYTYAEKVMSVLPAVVRVIKQKE